MDRHNVYLNQLHRLPNFHPRETQFTAEASELGLTPGQWPDTIEVEGVRCAYTFHRVDLQPDFAQYRTMDGDNLVVFND